MTICYLFIFSFLFLLTQSAPKFRILNGENALEREFSSVVQFKKYGRIHFCGGVLINPDTVVTAFHCIERAVLGLYTVVAGCIRHKCFQPDHHEERLVIDTVKELESPTGLADIALVKLEKPILESPFIKYANLPCAELSLNSLCYAVGLGYVDLERTESKRIMLQKTQIQLKPFSYCQEDDELAEIAESGNYLCGVGVNNSAILDGDSGYPLYCIIDGVMVLTGITSNSPIDDPTRYALFTNVYKYVNSINAKLVSEKNEKPKLKKLVSHRS